MRQSIRLAVVAVVAISASPAVDPGGAAATSSSLTVAPNVAGPLPGLPQGWPSTHLELGLTDSPGGASALHVSGAYKFRYQYLCGGVNTGTGWSTWNSGAKFADYYVDESVAAGITPVFIYYQLLQSSPGGGPENQDDLNNLKNTATRKSYWADVRLMFQHLGAYSSKIVVDIEPDLWGYIQQASSADAGSSVPAAVTNTGDTDVSGLANNAAGFAQAFVRLRNKYAPNVLLGYELSMWGTNTDPTYQNTSLSQIDALAARSTAFQQSLGAGFDLVFTDPADRDAAFDQIINGDGGASWWDAADYQRFDEYVGDFVRGVGLRMVLWQIPLGNTKMRAVNNTWDHYQDNHVEWWFDDPTATHLSSTVASGVVAMLFGGGADGTTSATDAMGDGVTNPAPINGNNLPSYSADDDGGYFRHQINAYYAAGSLLLPGMDWTISATAGSAVVLRGGTQSITAAVYPNITATARVDVALYGPGGSLVRQWAFDNVSFAAGQGQSFPVTWTSGSGDAIGVYAVQVAVSTPGGGNVLARNDGAATFSLLVASTYHPLTPARLLDTRTGTGLSGPFSSHVARTFQVTGGAGGIPANATAVTGNLTVTGQTKGGFLYVGPVATNDPTSSTLNFPIGDDRANAVTVALGDGINSPLGTLSVTYVGTSSGSAQVIFDVTGFFTPDLSGARYVALTPARILDTRNGPGGLSVLSSHVAQMFTVAGVGGVPVGATAVTGNLTVTGQSRAGFLYVGPVANNDPTSSTLNFPLGDDRANAVTVALGTGPALGALNVTYVGNAPGATTQAIFDVTGCFVP